MRVPSSVGDVTPIVSLVRVRQFDVLFHPTVVSLRFRQKLIYRHVFQRRFHAEPRRRARKAKLAVARQVRLVANRVVDFRFRRLNGYKIVVFNQLINLINI